MIAGRPLIVSLVDDEGCEVKLVQRWVTLTFCNRSIICCDNTYFLQRSPHLWPQKQSSWQKTNLSQPKVKIVVITTLVAMKPCRCDKKAWYKDKKLVVNGRLYGWVKLQLVNYSKGA